MNKKSLIEKWKDNWDYFHEHDIENQKMIEQDLKELRDNLPNLWREYQKYVSKHLDKTHNLGTMLDFTAWLFDTKILGDKHD